MAKKALTVSIVIPVYNEEHHLRRCLVAIAEQTTKPDEVLVIDNNSSDGSMDIARDFAFARIIKEVRQGLSFARARGYNEAKSDIVAKLDADSIIDKNWVERLTYDFSDSSVAAVTGLGRAHLMRGFTRAHSTLWPRLYYWYIHAFFGGVTMWGANMAIRQNWWQQIRTEVSNNDSVTHEDEDVSLCILARGGKIIQDNKLLITTGKQSYGYFPKLIKYSLWMSFTTYYHHQKRGTFKKPFAYRLSLWSRLHGLLVFVLLGPFALIVSFLFWPIDEIMLRLPWTKETWLD